MKFVIECEPRTKKNSGRIITCRCKRMLIPSKAYKEYELMCTKYIPKVDKPINEAVNVKALYYMGTRRIVDIINLHSALHDILVRYRVIEDDNYRIVASTDGSRVLYDKQRPRTEVEISKFSE